MNLVQRYISPVFGALKSKFEFQAKASPIRRRERKLTAELVHRTHYLSRKDIGKWRRAWQQAIDADYPVRFDLLQIYRDIMVDNHLSGAINNRKNKVLKTPFVIVDDSGEPNEDLTRLLQKPWFRGVSVGDEWSGGFISLALDAIFYGHSLIQFEKTPSRQVFQAEGFEFQDVEIVPREYIIPELGMFVSETHHLYSQEGFSYLEPPFSNWAIEIGHRNSLGLLLKAAPQAISKKNLLGFWDEFAEIFGMPIRIGKTTSRGEDARQDIESMLKQMGTAAWAVFPEGTDIEIKETTRGDAFQVYDSRIERANSEMSKLILGQTMTMDDGSSRSQSEVHERVAENLYEADLTFIEDEINKKLIPFLVMHGYPLTGYKFAWDISEEITENDRSNDEFILTNFEVGDEFVDHIRKKYRVPIEGIKQKAPMPGSPPQPSEPEPGPKAKKKDFLSLHSSIEELYKKKHPHEFTADKFEDLEPEMLKMIRSVFDGEIEEGALRTEMYLRIASLLISALDEGWLMPESIDYNSPDNEKLAFIQNNIHAFSAAKSLTELQELRGLMTDEEGNIRTFRDFKEKALELHTIHNLTYLKTEFQSAMASAQMGSQWLRYEEAADVLPNLIYETVGDDRVRPDHENLDGVIAPLNDPFWDSYYPPNGWGCRCDVRQTDEDPDDPSAIQNLAASLQIKPYFQRNVGKTAVFFPEDHPYFSESNLQASSMTALDSYGFRPLTQLYADPSKLPAKPELLAEESQGIDPLGIVIKTQSTLDRNIIENADEVYSIDERRTYIKYYSEGAEKVEVNQTTSSGNSQAIESDRSGILLYKA